MLQNLLIKNLNYMLQIIFYQWLKLFFVKFKFFFIDVYKTLFFSLVG